jgi:hypothetical protein
MCYNKSIKKKRTTTKGVQMNGYDKMVSLSEQWGDAELLDEILRYLPDYKLEEMADSIANDYGFEFEECDADE